MLAGLSDMDQVSVLAALLVFRLFYLIIPLLVAIVVVMIFEREPAARAVRRCRNRRRPNERTGQPRALPSAADLTI